MSGLYAYDKDTGERIDCAERDGKWHIYGEVKVCTEGTKVGLGRGSIDNKVVIWDSAISRTLESI